jgi:type II secretory pathway pseudopilin PulG
MSPFRRGLKPTVLSAFTIIELLVSIAIFVVSSTLMLGAMFGATEVFRRGEAARQAGDEATAVIAALQEDLSRAVPIRLRDGKPAAEWGRLYAKAQGDGNCQLGFVIENPDRSQVRWINESDPTKKRLLGVRSWVVWSVVPATAAGVTAADDELWREEWDMTEDGTIVEKGGEPRSTVTDPEPRKEELVTRGCLHFAAWAEVAQAHRLVKAGAGGPEFAWESKDPNEEVIPFAGSVFDTADPVTDSNGSKWYPQPDALRISLVLTGGGRYATRGTLIGQLAKDDTAMARISGIKALPTTSGSLLRIGNEWIRYDDFRGGRITGLKRGQLRSTQDDPTPDRSLVLAGQPFSLVVALPR